MCSRFLSRYLLLRVLSRRGYLDLPESVLGDFVTWVALFGVMVGGRLGYVFFYKPEMLRDPLSILRVWEGGMSSHGGILGIVIFTLIYSRRHKLPWTNPGDSLCVAAPIGLFFGRCANFINGELYGRVTSVPWAVQFPKELLEPGNSAELDRAVAACQQVDPSVTADTIVETVRTNPQIADILRGILPPRHPSQLYEALLEGAVLFVILWIVRTRFRTPNGFITGLFLLVLLRLPGHRGKFPRAGCASDRDVHAGTILFLLPHRDWPWLYRRREMATHLSAQATL